MTRVGDKQRNIQKKKNEKHKTKIQKKKNTIENVLLIPFPPPPFHHPANALHKIQRTTVC